MTIKIWDAAEPEDPDHRGGLHPTFDLLFTLRGHSKVTDGLLPAPPCRRSPALASLTVSPFFFLS